MPSLPVGEQDLLLDLAADLHSLDMPHCAVCNQAKPLYECAYEYCSINIRYDAMKNCITASLAHVTPVLIGPSLESHSAARTV